MPLELTKVSKAFDSTSIMDGFSVGFSEGEISLIHGPSGAGKSTLLRAATLLDPIDGGAIRLNGTEFTHSDLRNSQTWQVNDAFRSQVTLVFQALHMWPHIRMRDAIELTWTNAPPERRMPQLVTRFGLDSLLDRLPNQLSLGQLQRFAILRALGTGARFFLFDEITSALDRNNKQIVADCIEELCAQGASVAIVSHDPTFLLASAAQIIEFGELGGEIRVTAQTKK